MSDTAAPAKLGRPSAYTDEKGLSICERITLGESLRSICAEGGMPSQSMVFRWLEANEAFRERYARAREMQADTLFDDILEISDDARNDWMMRRGEEDAGWVANGEHIQRSKLRVDARKWMAGKLRPKVYGEKVTQEISGPNGSPIQTENASDPKKLARAVALLLAEGSGTS